MHDTWMISTVIESNNNISKIRNQSILWLNIWPNETEEKNDARIFKNK